MQIPIKESAKIDSSEWRSQFQQSLSIDRDLTDDYYFFSSTKKERPYVLANAEYKIWMFEFWPVALIKRCLSAMGPGSIPGADS